MEKRLEVDIQLIVHATEDLEKIHAYTNTAFAVSPEQVSLLSEIGFSRIVFILNTTSLIEQNSSQDPLYREKFFDAYRLYLQQLRVSLTEAGVLSSIDIFYLADEPALHRSIYLDQQFLEQITEEFKKVFPEKKAAMVFAQNPNPTSVSPERGLHFAPPEALDIVIVDPYIDPEKVLCTEESVRDWVYEKNPASTIGWAKQYRKTIIVAGDAQLRNGKPIHACYQKFIFEILKKDKEVSGLVWFAYDKSYQEEFLSGAANDPEFVRYIESFSVEKK